MSMSCYLISPHLHMSLSRVRFISSIKLNWTKLHLFQMICIIVEILSSPAHWSWSRIQPVVQKCQINWLLFQICTKLLRRSWTVMVETHHQVPFPCLRTCFEPELVSSGVIDRQRTSSSIHFFKIPRSLSYVYWIFGRRVWLPAVSWKSILDC